MRCLRLLLLVIVVLLGSASAATAGSYTVHACGTPVSSGTANNSWDVTVSTSPIVVDRTCSQASGMNATAPINTGTTPEGSRGELRFTAPANTTLISASLNRALFTGGDPDWSSYLVSSGGEIEVCRSSIALPACGFGGDGIPATPTRWDFINLNASWLAAGIYCTPNVLGSCTNDNTYPIAVAAIHQASVTLSDVLAPTFAGVRSGPLTTTTSWQPGTLGVTTSAVRSGSVLSISALRCWSTTRLCSRSSVPTPIGSSMCPLRPVGVTAR